MTRERFNKIRRAGEAILSGMDGLFRGGEGDSKPRVASLARAQGPDTGPQMTIREFMTPSPVTTRLEAPLYEALELLIAEDLSALPVVNENGVVVGLLNERHLLNALGDLEAATISGIMDTEPVTVAVDEPIVEVADHLMVVNVRQVLVLEGSRLVGIVTRADLMPAVLEVLRQREAAKHGTSAAVH